RQGRPRRGRRPRHHGRLAERAARVALPPRDPDRHGRIRRAAGRRSLQADPDCATRELRLALRRHRPRPDGPAEMTVDALKAGALLLLAALVQVSITSNIEVASGHPHVLPLLLRPTP